MLNSDNSNKIIYKDLSYKIVGALFEAFNELGYGYQEKYYERAVAEYLNKFNIKYKRQASFQITSNNKIIGRYFLDFIVEDKIVLEIKKGRHYSKQNIEQIKGYLSATGMKLAILANFTPNGVKYLRVLNQNNKHKKTKKVYDG